MGAKTEKNLPTPFVFARRRAIFAARAHILSETPNAKEDTAVKAQMPNIGDVDDLIFQDCWLVSDR
nr:hypothetical protein [uncultured Dysosmobacter sp.]